MRFDALLSQSFNQFYRVWHLHQQTLLDDGLFEAHERVMAPAISRATPAVAVWMSSGKATEIPGLLWWPWSPRAIGRLPTPSVHMSGFPATLPNDLS